MPNPRRQFELSHDSAAKVSKQLRPMCDYLERFVVRLKAIGVAADDPMVIAANAAKQGVIDLVFTVSASTRPPKRLRWE